MSKLTDYISLLWSQVGKGIYVYGGNGEDLTAMTEKQRDAYMDRREVKTLNSKTKAVKYTKEQNIARCKALFEKRVKAGVNPVLAFDCSGLQYWAGKQVGVIPKDISANGIYAKCEKIKKSEVKKGDYCFTHNGTKATHVGMYVGDDVIIECQGRDVGVVTNKLSKTTTFNAFGRYPGFDDGGDESEPSPEPTPEPTTPSSPVVQKYVRVKGKMRIVNGVRKADKSVRVRSGNGTDYETVGFAHSTDKLPFINQEDLYPFWYKVEYKGKDAWITSNSLYTEVIPCD